MPEAPDLSHRPRAAGVVITRSVLNFTNGREGEVAEPHVTPHLASNHRWAMALGEAGLKRELIRRRGQ